MPGIMSTPLPPLLLIIFNNPHTTRQVIDSLRKHKPPAIYVSGDGARTHKAGEADKVAQTRALVQHIDWPCEVHTQFLDSNHGCRRGVMAALDWFFAHVPEGIIIEDDIIMEAEALTFCAELLAYYRHRPEVWHISTNSYNPRQRKLPHSYYATAIPHVWGWATWADRWQKIHQNAYPTNTEAYEAAIQTPVSASIRQFFWSKLHKVQQGQVDAWSYFWAYTLWKHNGMAINPRVNLSTNIGGGIQHIGANHKAQSSKGTFTFHPIQPLGVLLHPATLAVDSRADAWTYRNVLHWGLMRKIKNKLWTYWERIFPNASGANAIR
jgi:hypothetical protein